MSLNILQTNSLFTTSPAILTPSSGANVLTANAGNQRNKLLIQNVGTNPVYVNFGGTASTTAFHFVLKACAVAADGSGGSYESGTVVWQGAVSVAGTTPSVVVLEM
jgi:hypothetical protein